MGKGTDKLYVTATEHALGSHTANLSGAKGKRPAGTFARLPFDCCALSLKPFEDLPVCTRDGTVYDLTNIMPWIRKHGTDPVTGKKLASSDLIKLNFAKNAQDDYYDPVSYKVFNEHTAIVAISTSGNVFTKDTVDSLNIKPGFWRDLVEDTPFTRKDLITLQDPHNLENRDLSQFHYIRNDIKTDVKKDEDGLSNINVAAMGGTSKIYATLAKGKGKEQAEQSAPLEKKEDEKPEGVAIDIKRQLAQQSRSNVPYNAANFTTGRAASSLTSTSADIATKSDRALIHEEEWMFERILPGEKAYVAMKTNMGTLNLELFCDKAPKTCYNFLMLAREGKYDNTAFHRHIPGFMIQGGDPTGTGSGGQSYWGENFRDEHALRNAYKHEARGMLSMANKGPNTNSSQFFFTFRATPHLNGKHTVFGKIVGGEDVLNKIERIPPNPATDKPTKPVRIVDVSIFKDPFEEFKTKLAKRLERERAGEDEVSRRARAKEDRDKDRTTWFGTDLGEKNAGVGTKRAIDSEVVGKYLASPAGSGHKPATGLQSLDEEPTGPNKKAKRQGFGNFEGW